MPRLEIDQEKCMRSGQCAYMQPELFELDADGAPLTKIEHPEKKDLITMANDAIEMCPAQAISWSEA